MKEYYIMYADDEVNQVLLNNEMKPIMFSKNEADDFCKKRNISESFLWSAHHKHCLPARYK